MPCLVASPSRVSRSAVTPMAPAARFSSSSSRGGPEKFRSGMVSQAARAREAAATARMDLIRILFLRPSCCRQNGEFSDVHWNYATAKKGLHTTLLFAMAQFYLASTVHHLLNITSFENVQACGIVRERQQSLEKDYGSKQP